MSVTIGSQIGPYEIVSALGAGGMGEVYRARDTRLGREVAIKIISRLDATAQRRFEQEARASCANRRRRSLSSAILAGSTLMATSRSSRVSRAR